jgi:hypothetical protein
MIDWNWLWVIGEVGISYGFYRWWKSHDKFLAILEVETCSSAHFVFVNNFCIE